MIMWPLVVPVNKYFSFSFRIIDDIWQSGGMLSHKTNGRIKEPLDDDDILL